MKKGKRKIYQKFPFEFELGEAIVPGELGVKRVLEAIFRLLCVMILIITVFTASRYNLVANVRSVDHQIITRKC